MSNFDKCRKYNYKTSLYGEITMQTIENAATTIREIWAYQHPLMHMWFVLSSLSLCFMFALIYFVM